GPRGGARGCRPGTGDCRGWWRCGERRPWALIRPMHSPPALATMPGMEKTSLLQTVERETGHSPQWSVIWLHGLGADGNDFMPIVPELLRPEWPAPRFVFPHAGSEEHTSELQSREN